MTDFILTQYFIALIVTGIINFGLGLLVILKGFTRRLNQIFSLYSFSLALWSIFEAFGITNSNESLALLLWRINHVGVIFIPIFLTHFIFLFLNIKDKRARLIPITYAIGGFFLILNATPLLILEVVPKFSFKYFINPGYFYYAFFGLWVGWAIYGNVQLFKEYFKTSGYRRIQMKYFCWVLLLSYIGGVPNFFPTFNFEIPVVMPYGTYAIPLYAAITAYSIIRYGLMDIRVAVTRAGIFVIVYSLVLGFPLLLGYKYYLWQQALWVMLVLATLGPFIYLYLQRKAEYKILQKEKDAEQLLLQASDGMLGIHDLQKVMNLIVDLVVKILHFKMASVYLWDETAAQYVPKASNLSQENKVAINSDDILIEHLKSKGSPLVYEEIKMMVGEGKDNPLYFVLARMEAISGHAIIPIMRNELLGFLILGERHQQTILSQDLLGVLTILCNQSALAIENAMYYEESQKDWTQKAHDSRLRTMGAMGTGIAHQIRNRLNAISTQCLLLQDLLDSFDPVKATPEDFYKLRDECKKILGQIFRSIKQGEEIVDAIKNYAKRTEATPQVVTFEQAVSGAMYLLKLSRKNVEFTLEENYPKDLNLWTNFSMLQDMLYNMLDNSNDAVLSKKQEIKEGRLVPSGEESRVNLNASINGKMCEISFKDNGMGIKKEHLEEDKGINVMYFTTKGATKGTGMGLALMRQFIRHNGGTMRVESEYTQWTKITFTLPLATEEQIRNSHDSNGQEGL